MVAAAEQASVEFSGEPFTLARQMSDFDRKFVFVTGKGGVGKSTVSAALALAFSRAGRRVLLALTEPGQGSTLLGSPLGSEITPLSANLHAVVLEPRTALRQYAELMLPSKGMVSALVDHRYSRGFLAAIPGLYPWAMLGKAWYHSTEQVAGRARFDHVIVDAPATGHGLEMLRVPKVITEAAAPGILKRDAELAWRMLRDPKQTCLAVVTLPEPLPVLESVVLAEALQGLGLPTPQLLLNAKLPTLFHAQAAQQLAQLPRSGFAADAAQLLSWADERAALEALQEQLQAQLSAKQGGPVAALPWVKAAHSPQGVAELASHIRLH